MKNRPSGFFPPLKTSLTQAHGGSFHPETVDRLRMNRTGSLWGEPRGRRDSITLFTSWGNRRGSAPRWIRLFRRWPRWGGALMAMGEPPGPEAQGSPTDGRLPACSKRGRRFGLLVSVLGMMGKQLEGFNGSCSAPAAALGCWAAASSACRQRCRKCLRVQARERVRAAFLSGEAHEGNRAERPPLYIYIYIFFSPGRSCRLTPEQTAARGAQPSLQRSASFCDAGFNFSWRQPRDVGLREWAGLMPF